MARLLNCEYITLNDVVYTCTHRTVSYYDRWTVEGGGHRADVFNTIHVDGVQVSMQDIHNSEMDVCKVLVQFMDRN